MYLLLSGGALVLLCTLARVVALAALPSGSVLTMPQTGVLSPRYRLKFNPQSCVNPF